MSDTNYIGIDYGMGMSNIDTKTGIRYGIISQRALNPDALDDIYNSGENLSWLDARREWVDQFVSAVSELIPDKEAALEAAEELVDNAMEHWESCGDDCYEYIDDDGTHITTSGGDLFVMKSPYTTRCQFCSPCVPGAGNLEHPVEDGIETYCLGPDWFDAENPMPYGIIRKLD